MLPHPLTNFKIQKYYQNEPKFNDVYSRNNLPKINDGAYVINLDQYKSIGNHWLALYVNDNNATYIVSFWVEHINNNARIVLYWIYWFNIKNWLYKFIFS